MYGAVVLAPVAIANNSDDNRPDSGDMRTITIVGCSPPGLHVVGDSALPVALQQSAQLQIGDVLDDDRRRDVWDVLVRADFRLLHGCPEAVGGRH